MELSHYLKIYACDEDPDEVILFSTRQASKVQLAKALLEELQAEVPEEAAEVLAPLGMAVACREDEIRDMVHYFERRIENNKALDYTLVMNLDCNFACPYCFEKDVKNGAYMTPDMADRIISHIQKNLEASTKNLMVDFYGGEPLLSLPLIKAMAEKLQAITNDMGRTFSFRMVTNGALFTREVAGKLVPLGLTGIKTTIDGPPDIHNKSRPFISGAGSFDVVLKNIKACADFVDIEVGGNYDADNYPEFVGLLDILESAGLGPDRLYAVKFDPIFQHTEDRALQKKSRMGCQSYDEPWILEADRLLRKEILKRGYHTGKPGPLCCMIENPDSLVINNNGDFFKCPCFVGVPEYCVGNLENGMADYKNQYGLGVWKNRKCLECVYLPLCFGGCRHMTYMQTGRIDGVSCMKDYLDNALELLVKQDLTFRA